ncbi:MAG TPA: peptidase M28 [Candidatus Rokubacteria bacterium]|nr:peptidase M28 [Candidatus Rokubacteria bacterium]
MRLRARGLGALLLAALAGAAAADEPFDGAAALRHVERLVALGPRPAGSAAAAQARRYLVDRLRAAGIRAEVQPFEADTPHGRLPMANVVAVLPGRRPDVILLGGHYDTKLFREFRFVGANDGGSSAALLLELARRLHARPREFTYWIAWFDGEEARVTWTAADSLYGSRRMAEDLRRAGRLPRAVLVADMIGDRDLGIRREAFSTPWLTDLVWASARRLGYGAHFSDDPLPVEDDHAPFLRHGVPAALLIDFDFPPWHTPGDTLDQVSARSLEVVGRVLLDALPAIEAHLARTPGGR